MKRTIKLIAMLLIVAQTTACSGNNGTSKRDSDVDDIVTQAERQRKTAEEEDDGSTSSSKDSSKDGSKDEIPDDIKVDVDLTTMNSDMVYATVYQMMSDPDSFVGQVIKLEGNYSSQWYEPTQKFYHYAIIQDAAACCAQGLEFVWGDGNHDAEDYPEQDTDLIVVGTFETYSDDDTANLYCRLADAHMVINE